VRPQVFDFIVTPINNANIIEVTHVILVHLFLTLEQSTDIVRAELASSDAVANAIVLILILVRAGAFLVHL
jgi:hypothetical protein